MSASTHEPLSASSLAGDNIKNQQDETLGSVHDIMLDCNSGKVSYVVMTSGGFLGMGNKLFAIPMSALSVDRDNQCLRMNASRETFEASEGFDKEHWPDFANRSWEEKTHQRYDATPYWV